MAENIICKEYQLGDEVKIAELYKCCFGRKISSEFWSWRFKNCPVGTGIIQLAWDNGNLAAHYATTPNILRINGTNHLTGLSGTTMTNPEYRGKRLFQELAVKTYKYMVKSNMGLVWGFPNVLIHRIRVRDLNWLDIYEIPTMRIYSDQYESFPKPSNNICRIEDFDGRFDRLWDRLKNKFKIISIRNSKYLHWRYIEHPQEKYYIVASLNNDYLSGYAVYKKYEKELQIVDILVGENIHIGRDLVFSIIHAAIKMQIRAVSIWFNVANPFHHELEKMGFKNEKPITYFGGLRLNSTLSDDGISDYRNWYITMGDSDVF